MQKRRVTTHTVHPPHARIPQNHVCARDGTLICHAHGESELIFVHRRMNRTSVTQRCSSAPHYNIKRPLQAVNSRAVTRKEDPVQRDSYQTGRCKESNVETVNLAVDVSEDQSVRGARLERPRFRSE